jgi:hypothetical protein
MLVDLGDFKIVGERYAIDLPSPSMIGYYGAKL